MIMPSETFWSVSALAQIAHDLRNPLNSISLEIDVLDVLGVFESKLIGASLADPSRFDLPRSLGRIRGNLQFIERLIHDLAEVSMPRQRFSLRRTPCNLRELLTNVIDRVIPVWSMARVSFDACQDVVVAVDRLAIERVIANLLDNALKYTPTTANIIVRLTCGTSDVDISVIDEGPGLPQADITQVFKPYQRGSTSCGRPGTGLGLYVAKAIVEAHGGRLGVENMPEHGARFFVAIPR
jgi:signal transduction histidine kinase